MKTDVRIKPPTKVFKTCAKAYNDKTPIIVHSGGTSSGKTYSIIQFLLTLAVLVDDIVITVCGQDIPNLKVGAYRDAQNIVEEHDMFKDRLVDHNMSSRYFRFNTGSVIEFNSYKDTQDAKSGKRDVLFVNEANGIPYGIFEELQIRASQLTIIDFNPTAEFWAHTRLYNRPDVTWVDTTYRDNPFVDARIIKKIESYEPTIENIKNGTADKYRWEVYGLGKIGRLEGVIFESYEIAKEWPTQFKWKVFGLDFGFSNDPTAVVELRYSMGKLYAMEHIYKRKMFDDDIIAMLVKLGIPKSARIIADSANPKSIEYIYKQGGYNIHPAKKGSDSILYGIGLLKKYPLHIYHRSRNLISEFNNYIWEVDKNGTPLNKPIDNHNHLVDAMRYAIMAQDHSPTLDSQLLASMAKDFIRDDVML